MDLLGPTHGLPELLAGAAVVGLHLWKKNTLLSIAVGTALYMAVSYTHLYGASVEDCHDRVGCRPKNAAV